MPARSGSIRWAACWSPARAAPISTIKGLLDKLGVTANVYQVGTYKAAVEPFTRTDMSPEAREALTGGLRRAVGELAAGGAPGAAQGAARRLCRRPAGAGRRGRRRHGPGGARRPGWSTGSASARRSTAGSPRSPASATTSVPGSFERIDYRQLDRGQSGRRQRRRRSGSSRSPATSSTARPISAPPAPRRSSGRSEKGSREHDLKALVVRVDSRRRLGPRFGADPPGGARRQGQGPAGGGVDGQRRRVAAAIGWRRPATGSSPSPRRSPARSACSGSCRASKAR